MSTPKIYIYAEYQVSIPFAKVEWQPVDKAMKAFPGLDNLANEQKYVDELLVPFARQIGGSLSVRLFDAEATREASISVHSPFFPK